jgi:thiamine kinase-like enzyme
VVRHGDFAPWNLLGGSDGKLRAIDWEYGSPKGFPYLDLAHYILQVAALIYRWSPSKALHYTIHYLTDQPWPALKAAEAEAITRLTAYHLHRQALEDGHAQDAPGQAWRRAVWEGKT